EGLRADLEAFLAGLTQEDPELEVDYEQPPNLEWIEPCFIEPAHPLAVAAQTASTEVLAKHVPFGVFPAGTDGKFWRAAGMPTIPALGPGLLTLAHRPNEYVGIAEIIEASRIYAITALRYLGAQDELHRNGSAARVTG